MKNVFLENNSIVCIEEGVFDTLKMVVKSITRAFGGYSREKLVTGNKKFNGEFEFKIYDLSAFLKCYDRFLSLDTKFMISEIDKVADQEQSTDEFLDCVLFKILNVDKIATNKIKIKDLTEKIIGGSEPKFTIEKVKGNLSSKQIDILNEFCCQGYDTFNRKAYDINIKYEKMSSNILKNTKDPKISEKLLNRLVMAMYNPVYLPYFRYWELNSKECKKVYNKIV